MKDFLHLVPSMKHLDAPYHIENKFIILLSVTLTDKTLDFRHPSVPCSGGAEARAEDRQPAGQIQESRLPPGGTVAFSMRAFSLVTSVKKKSR